MSTRRILAIFFALITLISISGCGHTNPTATQNNTSDCFVQIFSEDVAHSYYNQSIMYDSETLVMYLVSLDLISENSLITCMFNSNGTLRTYDKSSKVSSLIKVSSEEIAYGNYKQFVMCDPETLVMYLYFQDKTTGMSTVTVMYNNQGNPKTYNDSTKFSPLILVYSEENLNSRYQHFIMYDPDTLVMYLFSLDYNTNYSTITVMYNTDGSIKTYTNSSNLSSLLLVYSDSIPNSRYKQFIMYDPETLVMYLFSFDYISGDSAVTVMYNSDGSLRTYDSSSNISCLAILSSKKIQDSRYSQFIMYDPETLVIYLCCWDHISGSSALTVLYNADGSLKLKQ